MAGRNVGTSPLSPDAYWRLWMRRQYEPAWYGPAYYVLMVYVAVLVLPALSCCWTVAK